MRYSTSIITNAYDIKARYDKRASRMHKALFSSMQFAIALHELRKANLDKMIYKRTPYYGTKKPPTRTLYESEDIAGDLVYNSAPYALRRANMKGDYAIAPGLSREANWVHRSAVDVLPLVRANKSAMLHNILNVM